MKTINVIKYSKHSAITSLAFSLVFSPTVFAATVDKNIDECLLKNIKSAEKNTLVETLIKKCNKSIERKPIRGGVISKRIIAERAVRFDPYVISPHKMNYILPATVTNEINPDAYSDLGTWDENFEEVEAKFQLSIKVPLLTDTLFTEGDGLYFGITLQSWWQIYSDNISKPFRETNYKPEIFYLTPLNWHPFEGNTGLIVGFEHESNGRTQLLSRSWNRAYLNFLYEKDNFALSFKPWWRVPEEDKTSEFDPKGDDNPDIGDYMGHFELSAVYKWRDYEFSAMGRENFSEHHGALELGFTFPLWGKLRGYAQYFTGYGESMIDYNHKQQRLGLGIALTNVL
ncbi:MAG: phospholipase A [Colwellia sp.]